MGLERTYITLRKHYGAISDGEPLTVSVQELTEILNCTKRNAQLLLNKMVKRNFIKWEPGRGRGNTSKITFMQPLNELALEKAKELALDRKLDEAWKLLDQLQIVKFDFTEWLYRHLGFQHSDDEDILRFPFYRPVMNLDPTFVHRRTEAHLVNQLFDTLVEFDEKSKKIVPKLAHFWENNTDKTVWRFYLRKGVRFHHGKVLTSKDVFFTFKRMLTLAGFDDIKGSIKEIKMVEKYVIEFILNDPDVLFIHYLASERCSILPHDLEDLERSQNFAAMPIGTGPFRMKKNNESVLLLEANEHYFEGRPLLDGIEMWIWPNYDESKIIRKLEQDNFYIGDYPGNQNPQTQLVNVEQGATYLTFNLQKEGPMKNPLFRRAIHHAIDRKKMIRELGDMRVLSSCSFFPEYSQNHFQDETSLELSTSFLEKSGYQGEELRLFTYEMPANEQNANWLQKELINIGVKLTVCLLPINELMKSSVLRAEADMIVAGEVLGGEPDIELVKMFSYQKGFIYNHLATNQMALTEKYLELCKREESREIRIQHLIHLQEILKKQYPFIFLYHSQQSVKHSRSLQGAVLNGWGNVDYKNIWIKR